MCESIHLSLRYFWMGGAVQKYQEELPILFLYSSGPKKGTGMSHFAKFGAIPFISVPRYTSTCLPFRNGRKKTQWDLTAYLISFRTLKPCCDGKAQGVKVSLDVSLRT